VCADVNCVSVKLISEVFSKPEMCIKIVLVKPVVVGSQSSPKSADWLGGSPLYIPYPFKACPLYALFPPEFVQTLESPEIKMLRFLGLECPGKGIGPGKPWNLVFASPGKQCFNVCTNPVPTKILASAVITE